MGRAKLKLELITNERARNIKFKNRKEGLLKKIHELTVLCDVNACMIIYGPKRQHGNFAEPEIWPPSRPDEVKRMIDYYKAKSKEFAPNKKSTLTDIDDEGRRKVEDKLVKLRKKNSETKYPIQLDNSVTEAGRQQFGPMITQRAESVRVLIDRVKRRNTQQGSNINNRNEFAHARFDGLGFIQQMEVTNHTHDLQFPTIKHHQVIHPSAVNQQNPLMTRTLLSENEHCGFGLSDSSYQQHERTTVRYYAPQTFPYIQIHQPQHMQFLSNNLLSGSLNDEDDVGHYQMKNDVENFPHHYK